MTVELLKISEKIPITIPSVKTWGQIFRDTIFGLVVGTTYYYERRQWTHDAAQAWLYIL